MIEWPPKAFALLVWSSLLRFKVKKSKLKGLDVTGRRMASIEVKLSKKYSYMTNGDLLLM